MIEEKESYLNSLFNIWFLTSLFLFLLWSIFTRGRNNGQLNAHEIEKVLRKMEAEINRSQREEDMRSVEDAEDISELLKQFYEKEKPDKSEADPVIGEEAVECEEKSEEKSGEVEDKKTV
ncbi:uncharacterized protein LOC126883288 isoform X3 [Diabrotica virgifera virgifera]|uniref:Uncharacterized protein n=1 Tax=Diabrotica virgifera virgifera TaxID=50390 RepID=A0ABM5K326_DIAVI|nr:uncharacterized protein LOC126883288 isoform X3 [Diabrotica virgifera virgifera]